MKFSHTNISRDILFSLTIAIASCSSDGDKGKSSESGDSVVSTGVNGKTEVGYDKNWVVTVIDSTAMKGAAFDWNHEFLKDCAAQAGTLGLSFNVDSMYNNISYGMDIENFQYEELRFLRSIPYAKHGHWFKEGDLFEKFNTIKSYLDTIKPIAHKYAENRKNDRMTDKYWTCWENDYPKTYGLIKLNEKESDFVKRVDEEIEKRNKKRYVNKNGLYLLNVNLAENLNYFHISDTSSFYMLGNNNFCISETRAEQMYNPYESYHGLPHYITTDLYLSAYNAYLAWLIQSVEESKILPQIREFAKSMFDQSLKELESCTDNEIRPLVEHSVVYYAIANRLFNVLPEDNATDFEKKNGARLPENLREIYNDEIKDIDSGEDIPRSPFLGEQMLYSLFKPRGFYTRNDDTKMYFKGMMWLQNAKYRLSSLDIPLYLALQYDRSNPTLKRNMEKTNKLLTYLIGDIDNCSIIDLSKKLSSDFGIKSNADIKNKAKWAPVVDYLKKENQRCNRIFNRVQGTDTIPELNFMPQRYTPDAEVLMWMCEPSKISARPFPDGLDFLYSFGNSVAGKLLSEFDPTTKKWGNYSKMVDKMQSKFVNYPYFNRSVYEKNLEVLVSLQNEGTKPDYMKTVAWERKNTNTALASWAELKHTSILYAEQPIDASETGEGGDEFYNLPDPEYFSDIVEPNLNFWEKAIELLEQTKKIFEANEVSIDNRFYWLLNKADEYASITRKELSGEPINVHLGTGGEYEDFCNSLNFPDASKINQTDIAKVADIYTRQISQAPDNGILHTGIALANSIYVVVENNGHTYITEGAVYDYRLTVLESRQNDDDWRKLLNKDYNTGRPKWMEPYVLTGNNRLRIRQDVGDRSSRGWAYSDAEYESDFDKVKNGWFY